MTENIENIEKDAPSARFLSVELVFDGKSNFLNAILSDSQKDHGINRASLQQLIVDKNFESFMVPSKVLEDLLRQIQSGKTGIVPLAEKPVFIAISYVIDDETKTLDAVLSESDDNSNISRASLQEKIKENKWDCFNVTETVLLTLLRRVENKETGVFRIGEMSQYSDIALNFDDGENILFAQLSLSYDNPNITTESLTALINKTGYDTLFFEEKALDKIIEKISSNERGSFPLAVRKDASVSVDVDESEMSAVITTVAAYGGLLLTRETFDEEFLASKLDIAYCDMKVKKQALNHEVLNRVLFSKGVEPVVGVDAVLTALIDEVVYSAPKVDEKGVADLLEVNDFTVVDVGEPLMRKTPATEGKCGYDVFGESVPAKSGQDLPFAENFEGAELDPKDENLLLAARKGHPLIKSNTVDIDKTLHVNNVNTRIGNINFDGSLMVDGDVTAGVEVEVTGSIVIKGVVTHASINAGGDIIINGGVMGEKAEAKDAAGEEVFGESVSTHINAVGKIKAQYLSLASVESQEDIEISEYCSHCNVRTQSALLLGQPRGKGRIMGGTYYAKKGISAKVLGTDANIKTYVSVGFSKEMQKSSDSLSMDIRNNIKQSNQLTVILQDILAEGKRSALPPQKIEKAKKLRAAVMATRAGIDEKKVELGKLKATLKLYSDTAIDVKATLYPNVFVEVNAVDFIVRKVSKGGKFTRFGNDIRWE